MPTEAERERIRAKCGKVLEDTRKAERSLILMQQKLEPLRLQEEALKQSADEKKREADAELLQYAASVCRELCDKVQNALPREIRDLIYSHFTGGEKVRICKSDSKEYSQIGYFESISESAHTRNDNTIDADHWWNPSFVGPDMVRELGEQYFRSSCFLVDSIDLDIMDRFRVHDQWKLGLLPASFIRSLNIQIRCYQYDFDNEWHLDDAGLDPFGKDFDAAALAVTNARLGEAECGYKWAIPKSVAGLLTRALGKQTWMLDKVATVIFPTLSRITRAGYRGIFSLEVYEPGVSAKFLPKEGLESFHGYKEKFLEYAKIETAKYQQALLDGSVVGESAV